ncbi:MFS general substrate transporter [Stemphylium lycopersici]|nr:MFS general substrate transporter [Stemphylium lycopersici]
MASAVEKPSAHGVEHASDASVDAAVAFEEGKDQASTGDGVICTDADSKRILRKTDIWMLSLLCMVYFLQSADKGIIGLTAVYGLREDAHLTGNDYSNIGNIGYYAQLGVQPIAAWVLVKLRYRHVLPVIITCWGISVAGGLGGSTNYAGLLASRFFLGAFEAAVIPLFSMITIAFYRRSEQPFRVACWYSCYGLSTLISAPIVYGFGRINSPHLYRYQVVYLFFGLMTIVIGLITYWWAHDSPGEARYLSPEDRLKAVERVKANQQGIVSHKFNWGHVAEAVTEPKYWLYMIMVIAVNAGASVSSVFGAIILQDLAGFSADQAVLLNMPFGALQFISILLASWLAYRFKRKSPFLLGLVTIVIVGVALLVGLPKTESNQSGLLVGYYLIAFVYAINPLLISWMGANCAGQTKKAIYYTSFNAGNSIGNIITPYIFDKKFKPQYVNALKGILAIWCILWGVVVAQFFLIIWMQKKKADQREAAGLPRNPVDYSMSGHYHEADADVHGENGLQDMTDKQNIYFQYLLHSLVRLPGVTLQNWFQSAQFRMITRAQRLFGYLLIPCVSVLLYNILHVYLPSPIHPMSAQNTSQEVATALLAELGFRLETLERIQSLWAGYGEISRVIASVSPASHSEESHSFVLKLVTPPPTKANDEGHTRKILSYRVEQYFYTHLAPLMPESLPVAKCLVNRNEQNKDGTSVTAMLLSDLRQQYPIAGEKRGALSPTQVLAALDWLSGFHGFWWPRAKSLKSSSLVLPPLEEVQRDGQVTVDKTVWLNGGYTYLATRRKEYTSLAKDYDAEWNEPLTDWVDGEEVSIAEIAAAFLAPKTSGRSPIEGYQTLIHGDVKSENLFTTSSGNEVAFYDFQYTGLGLGVCDLAKFFTCSVPLNMLVADQHVPRELSMQDGEQKLLRRYWKRLQEVGKQEYNWAIFVRHWETALVDWLRFQASWGFWGNTEWLEARVRSILKDQDWRDALISNVDKASISQSD